MAASNPPSNNRSFIPRNEFMTIIANASKGSASVKYGRAFLGSKYTLRLELDGKLDDQTLVRIYYIRGERKIAMTEAYSGQLLDFTTEATHAAFTLGAPSKTLCCEIFVYGNEAVIAHGMMNVEWSPSIAVNGYGRGVDTKGEPGLPYIPSNYSTVINYGDDPGGGGTPGDPGCGGGGTSSWTNIYQELIHPTTNEVVKILLPYTVEDLKGPKGDPGGGASDLSLSVKLKETAQYVSRYNASLFANGEETSTAIFEVPHGIYDARLSMEDENSSGLKIHLAREFQTAIEGPDGEMYQGSQTIYDEIGLTFGMRAWRDACTKSAMIGLNINDTTYCADITDLFGISSVDFRSSDGKLYLNIYEKNGSSFFSSVQIALSTSSATTVGDNCCLYFDADEASLKLLGCGANATIPFSTLAHFIEPYLTPSQASSFVLCAWDWGLGTEFTYVEWCTMAEFLEPYLNMSDPSDPSDPSSPTGTYVSTIGMSADNYLEVYYNTGYQDRFLVGNSLAVSSIELSTNSSGHVNGITIWSGQSSISASI